MRNPSFSDYVFPLYVESYGEVAERIIGKGRWET